MWMDSNDSSEYDDILKELDEELMFLYTMMGGREMVFVLGERTPLQISPLPYHKNMLQHSTKLNMQQHLHTSLDSQTPTLFLHLQFASTLVHRTLIALSPIPILTH